MLQQQPGRRSTMGCLARLDLRRLFLDMHVEWAGPTATLFMKRNQLIQWNGTDRMGHDTQLLLTAIDDRGQSVHVRPVAFEILTIESFLGLTQRHTDSTGDIVRLQQDDSNADF